MRYVPDTKVVTNTTWHNSCAHRLRAFRTNMVNPGQLQEAMELTHKTTTRVWSDCLKPRHRPNVALRQETKPFYRCNITGALVGVAPTFVSYRGSHEFQNRGPGMVQYTESGEWLEPVPVERKRAMRFQEGYTQVVGISDTQRREMLGREWTPTLSSS